MRATETILGLRRSEDCNQALWKDTADSSKGWHGQSTRGPGTGRATSLRGGFYRLPHGSSMKARSRLCSQRHGSQRKWSGQRSGGSGATVRLVNRAGNGTTTHQGGDSNIQRLPPDGRTRSTRVKRQTRSPYLPGSGVAGVPSIGMLFTQSMCVQCKVSYVYAANRRPHPRLVIHKPKRAPLPSNSMLVRRAAWCASMCVPAPSRDGAAPQGWMSKNILAVPLAALPFCTKVVGVWLGFCSSEICYMHMKCVHSVKTLPRKE